MGDMAGYVPPGSATGFVYVQQTLIGALCRKKWFDINFIHRLRSQKSPTRTVHIHGSTGIPRVMVLASKVTIFSATDCPDIHQSALCFNFRPTLHVMDHKFTPSVEIYRFLASTLGAHFLCIEAY